MPTLGRGQKRNEVSDEADPQLEAQRLEHLRRLEAPRTHAIATLPVAEWDVGRALGRVTKTCGRDLPLLGFHRDGTHWLHPAETLALLEDGLLKVVLPAAAAESGGSAAAAAAVAAPAAAAAAAANDDASCSTAASSSASAQQQQPPHQLSIQEAYLLVVGGTTPVVDPTVYAVFAYLYRGGFICQPRPPPAGSAAGAAAASTTNRPLPPPPLLNIYHRRGFSRAKARDGQLPPLFVAAVYATPSILPPFKALRALCAQAAPTPLRCACAWQSQVLFFDLGPPPSAGQLVHGPTGATLTAEAMAAAEADAAANEEAAAEAAKATAVTTAVTVAVAAAVEDGGVPVDAPLSAPMPSPLPSPPSSPLPSPPPSPPPAGRGVVIAGEDDEDEEDAAPPAPSAPAVPAHPPPSTLAAQEAAPAPKPPAPAPASSSSGSNAGTSSFPPAAAAAAADFVPADAKDERADGPPDSKTQRRLRRLAAEASQALRESVSSSAKPAANNLQASAASAARAAAAVERAAATMARPKAELAQLAKAMVALGDPDDGLGTNTSLWRADTRS